MPGSNCDDCTRLWNASQLACYRICADGLRGQAPLGKPGGFQGGCTEGRGSGTVQSRSASGSYSTPRGDGAHLKGLGLGSSSYGTSRHARIESVSFTLKARRKSDIEF